MTHRSARPAMCAIVGAAGAGKRTLSRGLLEILGAEHVTLLALDDYNGYLDLMAQHLRLLRQGETIFKPVYDQNLGRFAEPEFIRPRRVVLAQGTHGLDLPELRALWDVSIFLESNREDPESAQRLAPQRERADAVLSTRPQRDGDGVTAELRFAHPVPMPIIDALVCDPVAAPHFGLDRAAGGAAAIEINGRVDDVSRAMIEEQLLAALPSAPARRQMRLGVIADAPPGDRRSNVLALTQLVLAHYVVQRAQLRPVPTPAEARPARPAPGA